MSWYGWNPYVPVAVRKARALKEMGKLRKKGMCIAPVEIAGRTIAKTFWGKAWCDHLESFSDYANRLPRGRTYVRNGSVCHLGIERGTIDAIVSGSELYKIKIEITPLPVAQWNEVKNRCAGQIGSLLELLQGKLSTHVMAVVTDRDRGIFPAPKEIRLKCSCPDWAVMCKHVAAVLYGVGARLDANPALLFLLRGVDHEELVSAGIGLPGATGTHKGRARISDDALADVFGIEIAEDRGTVKTETAGGKKKNQSKSLKTSRSESSRKTGRTTKAGIKTDFLQETFARAKEHAEAASSARPVTGKTVAALRAKFDMSQSEFARLLGVSAASVGNWERSPGLIDFHRRTRVAWNEASSLTKRQARRRLDAL